MVEWNQCDDERPTSLTRVIVCRLRVDWHWSGALSGVLDGSRQRAARGRGARRGRVVVGVHGIAKIQIVQFQIEYGDVTQDQSSG